jgi:hypothetical protein
MNYELIKQLKKAGFKFRRTDYAQDNGEGLGCAYCGQPAVIIDDKHYIIPTTSELIEELGYNLTMITTPSLGRGYIAWQTPPEIKRKKNWKSNKPNDNLIISNGTGKEGETLWEALAKLLLELKK